MLSRIVTRRGKKEQRKETFLDRMGGQDALPVILDEFFIRVTKDEWLEHFLEGIDIDLLKWHQLNFWSIAFTSTPQGFDIESLISEKHRRLMDMGVDESDYNTVEAHFEQTLKYLNFPPEMIKQEFGVIGPLSFFILTKSRHLFEE